ncbi:MFS transporter, UMF1 family [Arachidicoccus rhizosphaerae]|jgi:UMF1 family MFS transporter|uniref:MFS transporter, UMF1 family n=1 Tax=Arachidicoccus rhizosphaerae TaxID=551991 RepID=A0A1H3W9Y2_9BACT|nr:MFS transporter [Arachidicoccus rhizosphaerae]SDZ83929.1 MFS transporter, UMF1 family [Arachidicoccus rhizosphaerae]
MEMTAASKKMIRGWAMYDWANSAYNLVITSTIFPVYYDALTAVKDTGGTVISRSVDLFGWHVESGALYNYAIAFAYLVIAFLSPILSSIADGRGNKKRFLQFFCYLGAVACCLLYFFTKERLVLGLGACIIAAIGYCGSLVFYNAYLPEIAPVELQDKVSAKGFAYGYVGSVLLQIICFVLVLVKPFGMSDGLAARISFLLVGLWWMGFAQMTFRALPGKSKTAGAQVTLWNNGLKELKKVLSEVKTMPVMKRYLTAFFFYSMGVQTVMIAATLFGSQELNLSATQLISCILIIQLVAIGGAQMMAWLSGRYGNINVLLWVVLVWIGICILAYFIQTATGYYIVATLVGIVMGGIQSLSRSTYSKFMPATTDTASYFSLYDVTEKIAIVLGTFSFGFVQQLTGSMRYSVVALAIFFLIGMIALATIRKRLSLSR